MNFILFKRELCFSFLFKDRLNPFLEQNVHMYNVEPR